MNHDEPTIKDVLDAISEFSSDMDGQFEGLKKELKGDINGIKGEITGIKGEITEIKQEISSMLHWSQVLFKFFNADKNLRSQIFVCR